MTTTQRDVQAVFVRESGEETVVGAEPVMELPPGGLARVELTVEMPHQPVRLRVEVLGSPRDCGRDPTADSLGVCGRECR